MLILEKGSIEMEKYLDLRNNSDYTKLEEPANIIKDGGIVIFPTETVYGDITEVEYKLMKAFFPGPFTIILKKKDIIPNIVTANMDTVGIRMPSGEIAQKIIQYANVPIATPSANISGTPSATKLDNIVNDFEKNVDYFVDGGDSKLGIASTIVKVIDGVPHILREGTITKEQILSVL